MGYPVTRANSVQFERNGETYALGCVRDDFGYWNVGLFHLQGGSWIQMIPTFHSNLQKEDVTPFVSTAGYLEHLVKLANARLDALDFVPKPDVTSAGDKVRYDIAKAVTYDEATGHLVLSPIRPLPHAQP